MPLVRVPGQRVAGARMCILSITIILLLFATRIPVHAIPSCSSGTMASYLTLGAAGCQFGDFTFSDFTYFAGFPNSTTTLLLWGTTMAGLGLARWSHRKNLMRSGAHTEKPDSRRKQ